MTFGTAPAFKSAQRRNRAPPACSPLPRSTAQDFATFTAANGIQAYTGVGTAYAPLVSTAAAGANVNLAGSDTVTVNTTINALMLSGAGGTLTINPGVTLTISSGAILDNGATVTITGGGILALGEAILNTTSSANLTINTTITGIDLTVSGSGTLNLPTANAITGSYRFQRRHVESRRQHRHRRRQLNLTAGTLKASVAGGLLFTNPLNLNNANVTLDGSNPLLFGENARQHSLHRAGRCRQRPRKRATP